MGHLLSALRAKVDQSAQAWDTTHQTLSGRQFLLQIVQTSSQSMIEHGMFFSSEFTVRKSKLWTSCDKVSLRNGNAWTSAWSTMQLNSGVVVFAPVWPRKAVISNSHCRTSYRKRYCMTNSFCVFNDFGRFGAIFTGIFLVVSACSLDVLEILCISEIDREQLRNQQRLFHNHIKIIHACFARFSCNLNVWLPK